MTPLVGQWFRITGLRTLSLVFAALFVLLLPSVMPPTEYGRFALALSIAQTLSAVVLSWPNQAMLRFGREAFSRQSNLGDILATRFALHVVLLLPALLLAAVAAKPLADFVGLDPALLRASLLVGLPLLSLYDFGTFVAQAVNVFHGYGWAPLAQRIAQLGGLGAVAGGLGGGWLTLMAATLVGYGAAAALVWSSVPRPALARFRPSWRVARRMLGYARFQPLVVLGALLITWMDIWFLELLADAHAVGIYALAYSITLVGTTLLVPLSAILAPQAVDHRLEGDHEAVRLVLGAVGSACVLLTCLVPPGLGLISVVMRVVDLGDYSPALLPVMLLLAGTIFQLGMAGAEPLIYASERATPIMAGVVLTMAGINAIGDIVLIPILGLVGPALATVLTYCIGMILSWKLIARTVGDVPSPLPFVAFSLLGLPAAAVTALPVGAAIPASLSYGVLLLWAVRRTKLARGLFPLLIRHGERTRRLAGWLGWSDSAGEKSERSIIDDGARRLHLPDPAGRAASRRESRRQRILVVTRKLDVGGAERHLLQVLPHIDRRHFDVRVRVLRGGGKLESRLRASGIPVEGPPLAIPEPIGLVVSAASLLARMITDRQTIYHFFLPEAYIVGGLCGVLSLHPRLVMSRRSLNRYQVAHPYATWIERILHKRMRIVLGNSRAVLRELAGEGVPVGRLKLLYNGTDTIPFKACRPRREVRSELGVGEDALVLILVANLIRYKGHADLLAALTIAKPEMPATWCLLCVGRDDGIQPALVRQAEEGGISEHVLFLGERLDVPNLLKASDIGLLCSHEEGFSNSVLEGMAAGLPMIVTDVGGNAEAVLAEQTGIVVPPRDPESLANAIIRLAAAPGDRLRLGTAGRERVEATFSLKRCVSEYEQIYQVAGGFVDGSSDAG